MERLISLFLLTACSATLSAAVVGERWGPAQSQSSHPGRYKADKVGKITRVVFDLSAIPQGAEVYRARLSNQRIVQPRKPIIIKVIHCVNGDEIAFKGEALKLTAPLFRQYDLTDAVRSWVADPAANRGLAFVKPDNFDLTRLLLDIWFEGEAKNTPTQIDQLRAVHHDGQTFLTWQETKKFQVPVEEVAWYTFDGKRGAGRKVEGVGKGFMDLPHVAGITQGHLRRMQQYKIINPPNRTQQKPKCIRQGDWPSFRYRLYRAKEEITAETIGKAELLGESGMMNAYDLSMIRYSFWDEFYDKREIPDNFIATFCLSEGISITPGHAYYVHTPTADGTWFYAATVVKNGTENLKDVSEANSLAEPVTEKKAPILPVLQWAINGNVNYRKEKMVSYKYYIWPAPPCSHIPFQQPRSIHISVPEYFKEPGRLEINGNGRSPSNLVLRVAELYKYGGYLGYNAGQGTLRAFSKCKVDYFADRYTFNLIRWCMSKYKIDPNFISMVGATHFCLRHPEFFKVLKPGFCNIDFDRKWNPARNTLERLGPKDEAVTVDGHPAWSIYDISWYLQTYQNRDIPFFIATNSGKEFGHHVEYGWQDDPKGWAALRDGRQPHVGAWGAHLSHELSKFLKTMVWDRSVPAFSHCSLDSNPGNGDPSDGDLWGQINGFLIWDYDSIVDEQDKWEMTVFLGRDAIRPTCTVDLTPRHRKQFNPKPGTVFKWTNTDLKENKQIASGKVTTDKWGLVTLKTLTVSRSRNRIRIWKEQ